jgi:hypothetical protein
MWQLDILVADFGGIRWRGWHATNTLKETFFGPSTFAGFDDNGRRVVPEPWERMDFFIKSKGRRAKAKTKRAGR